MALLLAIGMQAALAGEPWAGPADQVQVMLVTTPVAGGTIAVRQDLEVRLAQRASATKDCIADLARKREAAAVPFVLEVVIDPNGILGERHVLSTDEPIARCVLAGLAELQVDEHPTAPAKLWQAGVATFESGRPGLLEPVESGDPLLWSDSSAPRGSALEAAIDARREDIVACFRAQLRGRKAGIDAAVSAVVGLDATQGGTQVAGSAPLLAACVRKHLEAVSAGTRAPGSPPFQAVFRYARAGLAASGR